MIEKKKRESSEILFKDDFQLNEERRYDIWNHSKQNFEQYIIKKEKDNLYTLYFEESESKTSIMDFYGIWSDLTEEEITFMEDSIKGMRNRFSNRYRAR